MKRCFTVISLWKRLRKNTPDSLPGKADQRISEMQTSAYFVAQAFFGDNGYQGNVDDNAYRQYDSGPGNAVRIMTEAPDQQLQRDTQNGNFYEKIERACQYRKRQFVCQKGENFDQDGDGNDDGKSQLPEPSSGGVGSQESDQVQIEADGDAIRKECGIDRCFCINDSRKGEEKETDAYTNDKKGPQTALEDKKVQQKAGNARGGENDRQQNAQVFSFYHFNLTFRSRVGTRSHYGTGLFRIDDRGITQGTFFQGCFQFYAAVYTI